MSLAVGLVGVVGVVVRVPVLVPDRRQVFVLVDAVGYGYATRQGRRKKDGSS